MSRTSQKPSKDYIELLVEIKERIRVINSATHSKEDLDFAIGVFEKVGKELGVI